MSDKTIKGDLKMKDTLSNRLAERYAWAWLARKYGFKPECMAADDLGKALVAAAEDIRLLRDELRAYVKKERENGTMPVTRDAAMDVVRKFDRMPRE